MRYELEPTTYAIRVYDQHPENYVATAILRVYGDKGWVSNISSPRLFEMMSHMVELMDRVGIATLEGYMSRAMARAIRMASREWASFEITHYGNCAGRNMPYVVVRRKQ